MAKRDELGYTKRLKATIKENERKIIELKREVERLTEELRKHYHDEYQTEINKLNEQIQRHEEENKSLNEQIRKMEKKIGDLEESNKFLEEEMERIRGFETKLKIHDKEIKQFELSEDELVIRALCSKTQENILKIVLQKKHFKKIQNKSTKYIPEYIKRQIKDEDEKKKAESRWEELREELEWDDFWIKMLKPVKDRGNIVAHPYLTVEKIDAAKVNLKKKNELDDDMAEVVDHLKHTWLRTEDKLLQGAGSAECANQGDQRNWSARGKKRGTARGSGNRSDTKRARTSEAGSTDCANQGDQRNWSARGKKRGTARGSGNRSDTKRDRTSETSSTEGRDQGGASRLSAPGRGQDTYASIVAKGAQSQRNGLVINASKVK